MLPELSWAPPGGAGFSYPTFYLDADNYYKPFDSTMGIAVGGTAITLDAAGTAEIGGTVTLLGPVIASGIAGTADWYIKLAADGTASIGDPSGGTVSSFKTWAYAGTTIVADSTTDTVTLIAGNGMGIAMSPGGDSVTLTATAGGVSTAFKTIAGDSGANAVADSSTDTLTIAGGNNISTVSSSGDQITIDLDTTATLDTEWDTAAELPINWGTGLSLTADTVNWAASFSDISGSPTDAQVPNDITIAAAGITGSIDSNQAVDASFVFESELTTHGADTNVHHSPVTALAFSAITGSPTDAQVPNDITITAATISGSITSAQIAADMTRDAEAAAAYQPLDATLTDLADGSLGEAESIGDAALPTSATFNAVTGTTVTVGTSLVISGDTVNDLAGAGISVSGNALIADVATLTAAGISELATTTESITGTDATRAVTPDGLTDALASAGVVDWTSDQGATNIHSGNVPLAATASALAANSTNCAAGEIPLGVDASGAVEGCYEPAEADISDLAHTATGITDNLIVEADLNADESPTDNDILTYDTTGANFSWQTPAELSLQPLDATLTDLADGTLNEANSIHNDALPETISVGSVTATTTLDIPSGATVDANAAGELGIDTTDDQLVYYGGAERIIPYRAENSFAVAGTSLLENPDTHRLVKSQDGITITDIHCITDTGTVIIELMEQDSAGANDATVDAPITCDSNGAEDDGTLANGVIDAADWLASRIGTAASSPTILNVTWYYTVNRE